MPNSRRLQPPEDDEEPPPDSELDPAALHAQLQQRVKDLEETLGRIKDLPPGIGHNRPPEPLDPEPLDEKDRQEIATALQTLKAQPVGRIDLNERLIIFESLKKRRRGVFRAIPIPQQLIDDLNRVHSVYRVQRGRVPGDGVGGSGVGGPRAR